MEKPMAYKLNLLFLALFLSFTGMAQNYIDKVVIDAGHGGKDPGALGRYSREKDITLAIALKTGEYIRENLKDVEVIYTREDDTFIELHRRAEIANKSNADFFISIHCNANRSSQPYGTETYVMGLHKTEDNLEVAKKENAAILLEENYRTEYDGFDPNSDEGYISLSIMQNAYLDQSILMADLVQEQFRERVGRKDRSVRQAGFLVLYRVSMPSILIETGFLSNPKEEAFLMSKKGQVYIASAIYRAFKEYKQHMEKNLPPRAVSDNHNSDFKTKPELSQQESQTFFAVQIATSPHARETSPDQFRGVSDVWEYYHGGLYKYAVGKTRYFSQAKRIQARMQKKGYSDAFIIAFHNGNRIPAKQALEILNE